MARQMLLYNSLQLVVMNMRLNRGELLVEVQDKSMYAEENTMDDVREPYTMAVTCPTGGHQNILCYAGTIEEDSEKAPAAQRDDVEVPADVGCGIAKAVDGAGDVHVQSQLMTVAFLPRSKLKRNVR